MTAEEAIEKLRQYDEVGRLRGSDRKKTEIEWAGPETVWKLKSRPGWTIDYLSDPFDIAVLGSLMGHCSGTHWIWACEEKIWQFFAVMDERKIPHVTIHSKDTAWLNKPHPRDSAASIPVRISRTFGIYPTVFDCIKAFRSVGKEYTPGVFKPQTFNSTTYDINRLITDRVLEFKGRSVTVLTAKTKGQEISDKYQEDLNDWYENNKAVQA